MLPCQIIRLIDKRINSERRVTSATALAVSTWTHNHLKYGHPKVGGGAIRAFQQRRGVCTDHSYLTVVMLSHLKIKVRLVSSRPLSNGLMNHVWTEVWTPSKHQWRVYDSTCGLYDFSKADYNFYLDYFIEPNIDHKHQHVIGQWN
ncbi:transglutaminase family protein [Sporolactobacillus shoreae]|uniref:Transglutaminase family protein n=1 Tax=Sporolactobacillus shoreae TaxID=1465501 RepID=A0A4Z0GMR5_9BACL|nr:transglutaminase family protein [Sporolactobacillus shoreae]